MEKKNKIQYENLLKDVLYYANPHSGASDEKVKGVYVGVMSTLMATGMSFEKAMETTRKNMPKHCRKDVFPITWEEKIT